VAVTDGGELTFKIRFRAARGTLSRAELRAATFMVEHPHDVLFETAGTLGRASRTSDATVVRSVQALGYEGLSELKRELGRELVLTVAPAERLHERLKRSRETPGGFMNALFDDAVRRLKQTQEGLSPESFDRAVQTIVAGETIFTWGLGSSSQEAQYAALRLRRLGYRAITLTSTGFHLSDEMLLPRKDDVLILYVRGRRTVDLDVLIANARAVGAKVVLVTAYLAAELAAMVHVALETKDSRVGLARETLASSFVTDALMLAIAEIRETQAIQTSQKLSDLRSKLQAPNKKSVLGAH
jgi:DNA-binding MurR/RpiR family transcriptional regulator